MRALPTSRRQHAWFLLAGDHAVASVNTPAALRRYRWVDGDPSPLVWPDDAAVVKVLPLDDWEIEEAADAADARPGSRRTPQGEALYDEARAAGLAATQAEETAARLEGRRPRVDVFTRAWSQFKFNLSAEDHALFISYKRWRAYRAREICRRSVQSIILDTASQQTVRAWARAEAAKAAQAGEVSQIEADLPDTCFDGGYPVDKLGSLITRWLKAACAEHAFKHGPANEAASIQRIKALQGIRARLIGMENPPSQAEIEAEAIAAAATRLVDLDAIDDPQVLRAMAVGRDVDIGLGTRAERAEAAEKLAQKLSGTELDAAIAALDVPPEGTTAPDDLSVEQLRAILRAGLPKAERYPELTSAIVAVKEAAEAIVWRGVDSDGPIWEEIADHVVRFSHLGKGGSSSSTPPG